MRYMRVEENAMDSPKFIAISANAWRLWCEGGTYCQKHLTDGLIPVKALRGFRYYSKAALRELLAVNVPEKGPLWHDEGDFVRVHDYLDWNERRDRVLAKRQAGKDRVEKWRDEQAAKRDGVRPPVTPLQRTLQTAHGTPQQQNRTEQNDLPERSPGDTGAREVTLAVRAGQFCQWYESEHQRLFGVGYMGARKDYEIALQLCEKFTDQQLQDAGLVWFGMEDAFATSGTRTIPKFASRVTFCLQTMQRQGIA